MLNVFQQLRQKISTADPFLQTAVLESLFQRYQRNRPGLIGVERAPIGTQREQVMVHVGKVNNWLLPVRNGELMHQCWLSVPGTIGTRQLVADCLRG